MLLARKVLALALPMVVLAGVAACGGDADDGTGFVVRVKIRGLNIAAMDQIQVRFEATGDDRFGSESGEERGVDYATEDGGRVFVATAGSGWITPHYRLSESEFVLQMPFVNPEGGGEVNLQVLIHRDVRGDMILVGESALTPTQLPTGAGAEVEVVVGCVPDLPSPCGAEDPPDPV
jgi:hypothetical protein